MAEPGAKTGRITYLLDHYNVLLVICDYGDAIYKWNESPGTVFALEDISRFDLSYFCEKCTSSPVGLPFHQWSRSRASKYVQQYFDDASNFQNALHQKGRLVRFADHGGPEALKERHVWTRWLDQYGITVFGEAGWNLDDIGMHVALF